MVQPKYKLRRMSTVRAPSPYKYNKVGRPTLLYLFNVLFLKVQVSLYDKEHVLRIE